MPEIQPTKEQLRAFRDHPREGPIHMLNLLKYKQQAEYQTDIDQPANVSGKEAYQRYAAIVGNIVAELGGHVIWAGKAETVFIGNSSDEWDDLYIIEYPSRAAFLSMISRPDYAAAHIHREAGLAYQKLIQCAPRNFP